ncbi:hypothetical protein RRG08_046122 [Elysia crispata]|uniref:Uncharacterized protein n=1 Tax=Elysia crispata TaxID=231223 RepID=A0AAE1CYQ6_9GAST|nr:hypothetical protein RRG08_046122 [Elysia crispata]
MVQDDAVPEFYPDWATERRVSIFGMICCAALIFISFFIFVPISILMETTGGYCLLYADTYGYGASSICRFTISCSVILLIICVLRLGIYAYKFFNLKENYFINALASWFSLYGVHIVVVIVDTILLLLLLVTACLVSAGTSHLCNSMFGNRNKCFFNNFGVILPDEMVNQSFKKALAIAEGAVWLLFVLWLLVVIFEVVVAYKKKTYKPLLERIRQPIRRSK